MSLSVEGRAAGFHGGSPCRSTSLSSAQKLQSNCGECSALAQVRARGDGVYYFEVTRPGELEARVFPFFERFPLRGPKKKDLEIFIEITKLVRSDRHLSPTGVGLILQMRSPMNRGGKRRYCDEEILAAFEGWESSEAIRRAPS